MVVGQFLAVSCLFAGWVGYRPRRPNVYIYIYIYIHLYIHLYTSIHFCAGCALDLANLTGLRPIDRTDSGETDCTSKPMEDLGRQKVGVRPVNGDEQPALGFVSFGCIFCLHLFPFSLYFLPLFELHIVHLLVVDLYQKSSMNSTMNTVVYSYTAVFYWLRSCTSINGLLFLFSLFHMHSCVYVIWYYEIISWRFSLRPSACLSYNLWDSPPGLWIAGVIFFFFNQNSSRRASTK